MAIEKFKKLIKFSKPENDDEYFEYTDDPDFEETKPRGGRRLFAYSFYGSLLTLGITFGANIAINSGGSGIEFGQGVTQTVNCQGASNITLTPYAGFQNESGGGFFGLDSIILEDVDQDCVNKDFIIKVFNNTDNAPLGISDSATSGSAYDTFTGFVGSPIGLLVLFGWSAAFWYHLLNGVRHLMWDMGRGIDLQSAYSSGYGVIIATAAFTIVSWVAGLVVWF